MHHPSSPDSVLAQQELEHKPPTPRAANGVELNLKAVWQATTLGTSKQVIKYLKKKSWDMLVWAFQSSFVDVEWLLGL